MKCIIYNDVNKFEFSVNALEPHINKKENVKIKVEYCGICGSDVHKFLYEKPNSSYVKTKILGHEIAGIVVETMKNIKNIKIGDKVVVEPLLYCNNCNMCESGHIQFCTNIKSIGRDFSGGFSEYVTANEQQIYKLTQKTELRVAALCDPYSVAMHIKNIINKKKAKIAILGDGVIGLACADILSNENNVTVFGKHDNRKQILNKIKVQYYDTKEIKNFNNEFDIVIEAVGGRQTDTLLNAIDVSKPKASILISGVYDNNFKFNISLRKAFYKELKIIGCNSFELKNKTSEFKMALDFISNKSKIANKLISDIFNINDFDKAIKYIKNRKENNCIKIMIKI